MIYHTKYYFINQDYKDTIMGKILLEKNLYSLDTHNSGIYQGDSFELIKNIPSESIHLILSDIPYGIGIDEWDVLHDNTNTAYLGSSPAQKNAGAIFKKRGKPLNGWSESDRAIPKQYQEWCSTWANEWYRVLKPGASALVFAGRRLSHRCVCLRRCRVYFKR